MPGFPLQSPASSPVKEPVCCPRPLGQGGVCTGEGVPEKENRTAEGAGLLLRERRPSEGVGDTQGASTLLVPGKRTRGFHYSSFHTSSVSAPDCLNLCAVDIRGWRIVCCRGLSWESSDVQQHPGLYLVDASSTLPPPSCDNRRHVSKQPSMSPTGTTVPPLRCSPGHKRGPGSQK